MEQEHHNIFLYIVYSIANSPAFIPIKNLSFEINRIIFHYSLFWQIWSFWLEITLFFFILSGSTVSSISLSFELLSSLFTCKWLHYLIFFLIKLLHCSSVFWNPKFEYIFLTKFVNKGKKFEFEFLWNWLYNLLKNKKLNESK